VNVAGNLKEIGIGVHQDGFEASSKEGTVSAVAAVKPLGVDPAEMPEGPGEIGSRGAHQQVVVVAHERVGMRLQGEEGMAILHKRQEIFVVGGVEKDLLAAGAAVDDVVPGAFEFQAEGAGHGGLIAKGLV
jgi:hypothetical protein